jgi:hypothetical protein
VDVKRPDGVTVVGVYHFLVAALSMAGVCLTLTILLGLVVSNEYYGGNAYILLGIGAVVLFTCTVVNVVAGWALFKMLAWGRWLSVVLGAMSLPLLPVGTLIGGAIIWYLMQRDVTDAFEAPVVSEAE